MIAQIEKNAKKLIQIAGESANSRAPHDTGNLQKRGNRIYEVNGQVYSVEWVAHGKMPKKPNSRGGTTTYPYNYAVARYKLNKKNPQTTEWSRKDYEANKKKYRELITKDVIL